MADAESSPDAGEPSAPAFPRWLTGRVVRGDQRGRELGFPTANVDLDDPSALPPDGVYAGWLRRANGDEHVAAISVGNRPTYYGQGGVVLLEAYLLDFEGDLYGETVQVGVEELVRGQVRFASEEELIATMHADVERVRQIMSERAGE